MIETNLDGFPTQKKAILEEEKGNNPVPVSKPRGGAGINHRLTSLKIDINAAN